jgi:hypothetical protein
VRGGGREEDRGGGGSAVAEGGRVRMRMWEGGVGRTSQRHRGKGRCKGRGIWQGC